MTPILKVITEYCAIDIQDQTLEELAREDMPLYARRMWGYLRTAIPLFSLPATMQPYLVGTEDNPKLKEPRYGNMYYTTTEEITDSFTLTLDENGKGYELFCCRLVGYDDFDRQTLSPTSGITYDSEAGYIHRHARKPHTERHDLRHGLLHGRLVCRNSHPRRNEHFGALLPNRLADALHERLALKREQGRGQVLF